MTILENDQFPILDPVEENGARSRDNWSKSRLSLSNSDNSSTPERRQEKDHSITNCQAMIHILKGNIGTGIFAMPVAIKNSGLLVGCVGLIFLSFFCVLCMHMLLKSAKTLCERTGAKALGYADVAEMAFKTGPQRLRPWSKAARRTIDVFLIITQMGFCCVYLLFVSQSFKLVGDHHFGSYSYRIYLAGIFVPMLILVSIRNLKYLAPVSMLASMIQMVCLALTMSYLVRGLPSVEDRKAFATWGQLPLYFGTALFTFEGIGLILPVENEMKTKNDLRGFFGVLNTAMIVITCLYINVAFLGYLRFGEAVKGSITLNLPVNDALAQVVICGMGTAIFLSYSIQFYVPISVVLPAIKERSPEQRHLHYEYVLRYAVVCITFALAAAIPQLDLFISLVGAVSSSTLALIAPPILDLVVHWPDFGFGKFRLWRNGFLFSFGFVGFATGTYASISQIISTY